jgi:hypothetical protein
MEKLDHNHERSQATPQNEHKHQNDDQTRAGCHKPLTHWIRATHSAVMDKEPSPDCPFCAVNLTTDHILWNCKETETKRLQMDITKEIWKCGKEEMVKLIKYVKEIELVERLKRVNKHIKIQNSSYFI